MSGPDAVPIEEVLAEAGWLRRLASELTRDPGAADDLVQETRLTALENPPDRRGSLRAWLARVLKSRWIDRRRRDARAAARERAVADPGPAPGAAEAVARAEVLRRVMRAVMDLPEPFRSTVLLRYSDGLSPAEIAERMEVAPATVRTRLHRGLERLRARLRPGAASTRRRILPLFALSKPVEGLFMAAKAKFTLVLPAVILLALGGVAWLVLPGAGRGAASSGPAPRVEPKSSAALAEDQGESRAPVASRGEFAPASAAADESGAARRAGFTDPDLARLSVWMTLAETTVVLEEDDYRSVNSFLDALDASVPFAFTAPPDLGPMYHGRPRLTYTPGGPPGREFFVLSALQSLSVFRNLIFEIRPDGVHFREGRLLPIPGAPEDSTTRLAEASGSWWRESFAQWVLAGRRAVTAGARIREDFGGLAALASLELSIPERTAIETFDDLRWALVRASGRELPVHLPRGLEQQRVAEVRRRGTAAEILGAALGDRADLRAVATRYGIEVVAAAAADPAVAERKAAAEVRIRLEKCRPSEVPEHCSLRDLGRILAEASGVTVFVDPEWDDYEVACEPGQTAAELLDGIRETFPYVGWTVVGEGVFVSRELPEEDR